MPFLHRFFGYNGKVKNPNAGGLQISMISMIIEIVKVDQALLELTHFTGLGERKNLSKGLLLLVYFWNMVPSYSLS